MFRGPRRQQQRRPRQAGQDGKAAEVEDAAIEAEFTTFVNKMKAKYPGNSVAYQINNFPEVRMKASVVQFVFIRFISMI